MERLGGKLLLLVVIAIYLLYLRLGEDSTRLVSRGCRPTYKRHGSFKRAFFWGGAGGGRDEAGGFYSRFVGFTYASGLRPSNAMRFKLS